MPLYFERFLKPQNYWPYANVLKLRTSDIKYNFNLLVLVAVSSDLRLVPYSIHLTEGVVEDSTVVSNFLLARPL